ncbi:MAG: L-threonylcarbamoyladenylate synthase [Gammaproteobacteria bacterium]|nr:L-threonylcarbamoyladenylate synthase [Gammaproteobacteria bacterium]
MTLFIQIHPDNPQPRLINQAASMLRKGGILVYPTDSCYALGCHIGDKTASEKIRRIRRLDENHDFTLMCSDLSEIGLYAKLDNPAFRLIKNSTPGPYTFILEATKEVPRRLMSPKRKTIGLRIPDNKIARELLSALGEPIISTTLMLPGDEYPLTDPYEMRDILGSQVNMIIDGGYCGLEPTTVVDMLDEVPKVVREGLGDISVFES